MSLVDHARNFLLNGNDAWQLARRPNVGREVAMRAHWQAAVVGIVLLLPAPTYSQSIDPSSLKWVSSVQINPIHDGNSCEPNRSALVEEARSILQQAGIEVGAKSQTESVMRSIIQSDTTSIDEKDRAYLLLREHRLTIGTAGVYLNGRCSVAYRTELTRSEQAGGLVGAPQKDAPFVHGIYFQQSGIWSGPPNAVTETMLDHVRSSVTELALGILKARQSLVQSR